MHASSAGGAGKQKKTKIVVANEIPPEPKHVIEEDFPSLLSRPQTAVASASDLNWNRVTPASDQKIT